MSVSSHIMFWYSDKLKEKTLSIFKALCPQLTWTVFPLIWINPTAPGSPLTTVILLAISTRQPCSEASEARPLVQVKADAYSAQSDPRLHPSCKPESVLRHFFSMLVDKNTRLLDPTCGSGSALRAAESLQAQAVVGLESDFEYCETARKTLKDSRTLRELLNVCAASILCVERTTPPQDALDGEAGANKKPRSVNPSQANQARNSGECLARPFQTSCRSAQPSLRPPQIRPSLDRPP